jgi:hypothetical protein
MPALKRRLLAGTLLTSSAVLGLGLLLIPRRTSASAGDLQRTPRLPAQPPDLPVKPPTDPAGPEPTLPSPTPTQEIERQPEARLRAAWKPAYLTEYHPNAPDVLTKLEGGRFDRFPGAEKHPVIWWEQHAADPKTFPFVTVAADLTLEGRRVPYGARLYLEAYPNVEFRLMDTGSHFFGPTKAIQKKGYEPFDLATSYQASKVHRLGISGIQTRYRVDFDDVAAYPRWLVARGTPPLVA